MGSNLVPPKITTGTPDEFAALNAFHEKLLQHINGGMSFATNFNQNTQDVTFRGQNVETPITHNLGRVPSGFLVVSSQTPGAVISKTRTEASANRIYLQSSVANANVRLLIF